MGRWTARKDKTAMIRRVLIYLAVMVGITAFSGLFILIFANSIQLSCVHPAGQDATCKLTTILLGRVPMSSRVVSGITSVQMDEHCDDGCSYRALLVTSNGDSVPVNEVYTDEGIPRRQIEALRRFLESGQPTLEYTEPVQWWVVALVGGLELMGVVIVAWLFLSQSL